MAEGAQRKICSPCLGWKEQMTVMASVRKEVSSQAVGKQNKTRQNKAGNKSWHEESLHGKSPVANAEIALKMTDNLFCLRLLKES